MTILDKKGLYRTFAPVFVVKFDVKTLVKVEVWKSCEFGLIVFPSLDENGTFFLLS